MSHSSATSRTAVCINGNQDCMYVASVIDYTVRLWPIMMQNILPKCPHAAHLVRDDASCSDWFCTCLQLCVFIRSPHHNSVNFCAGSLSRREAERICPGWRPEPGVCATPAARVEAAAGSGHPKHGIPLHQPGEHVCLQQRMLVPR